MISEYIYKLPSDMNLWIGKVKNYKNKILISSPGFNIGTNLEVNLNERKDRPDVKFKMVEVINIKPNVKQKRNLTSSPIKNTNKMLNLTSSSIKKANLSLIQIRSPMRKKRQL